LVDYTTDVLATDNCDSDLDIVQSPVFGTIISGSNNIITLTVTDDTGNSAQVSFNVAVEDTSDPIITSIHNEQSVDAMNASFVALLPDFRSDVTAIDNCDPNLHVTQSPVAGSTISGSTNSVTLTVTDDSGNSAQTTFNVKVVDLSAPVINSIHNDLIINDLGNCQAALVDYTSSVNAIDIVDQDLEVTQSPAAGELISGPVNEVTLTVMDDAGNSAQVTFNVAVEDNSAPVPDVINLSDITAECEVSSLTAPTANDNCAGAITATHDATLPITGEGTSVVITWTYDDGNGNTATQTQNVVIEDVTAPIPDVATLNDVTAECEVSSLTAPMATDNCAGTIIGTHDAEFPIEATTVVTWTFDDGNGNTATQTQNVVIEDVTAPVITCVANQTFEIESSASVYTVNGNELDPVSVSDNCSVATILNDFNDTETLAGAQINIGTTNLVWTATDADGNATQCSLDVTVNQSTGIKDLVDAGIKMYPNPTSGMIYIESENTEIESIQVFDITGTLVLEVSDLEKQQIDLSGYMQGVYIIKINTKDESFTSRIIKK
jgi:hypothetical protein